MNRYRRQTAFAAFGEAGQSKLSNATVAICGVGALGSAVAERLCRAGVGKLILIDRDWVELDNLPRQTLFTEFDAQSAAPKAIALANHLAQINSECALEPRIIDLHFDNIRDVLSGVDCIVDGTDNFETRFLINDFCCHMSTPWVHAGVVGAAGQSLTIIPHRTACFRCLLPEPPPSEQLQTCDAAGVLGPAVGMIANWQALEVMKILAGDRKVDSEITPLGGSLRVFDLWRGDIRSIRLERLVATSSHPGCPACVQQRYDYLDGKYVTQARPMCGRNSVHLHIDRSSPMDLNLLAQRLSNDCEVVVSPYLLRFELSGLRWTVFRDGRVILTGTEDVDLARKLHARWIGS